MTENFVVAETVSGLLEAEIIRGMLEAQKIEVVLSHEAATTKNGEKPYT